jgi:hypothetical protein
MALLLPMDSDKIDTFFAERHAVTESSPSVRK